MSFHQKLSLEGFSAVAFDFDGTLVDTMNLHFEAYRKIFNRIGLELTEHDFFSNIGGKASETIPAFLRGRRSSLSIPEIHSLKKAELSLLLKDSPIRLLPTARLLPVLSPVVPLALVSSGSREGIMQILGRLEWLHYFKIVITGEDTERSKPDPAPYLLAAERLGHGAHDMVAFEDTEAGMKSAKSAGMHAILVAPEQENPSV